MEDRGDIIKQMILNQRNPSVIALGDEINVSDILGEKWEDGPGIEDETTAKTDKQSVTRMTCSICGKVFPSRRYLNRHFSKHTDRYSCRTCGKAFARKETLLKHLPKCTEMKCKSPRSSIIKKRRVSETNKYVCESCSKAFTRRDNYDQHLLTHYGIQIECSICRKSLSSLKSYRRHQKMHEETTRLQKFRCLYCPSKFALKSNLERHYKLFQHQNKIVCSQCKQCVKTEESLHKHQNQIPVNCILCSKVFCLERHLKNHLKVNHPNLWFKCKECSTSTPFMTRGERHLQEHAKKSHKRELRTNDCYTEGWYILLNE